MTIKLVATESRSGSYVRRRRGEKGWSLADVARAVGYHNVSKGIRKIDALERGEPLWGIFKRLLEIPEFLDDERARQLLDHDGPVYLGQPANVYLRVDPAEKVCMNCRHMLWQVGVGLGVRCKHPANFTDCTGFYRQMFIPSRRFSCQHFESRHGRPSRS